MSLRVVAMTVVVVLGLGAAAALGQCCGGGETYAPAYTTYYAAPYTTYYAAPYTTYYAAPYVGYYAAPYYYRPYAVGYRAYYGRWGWR